MSRIIPNHVRMMCPHCHQKSKLLLLTLPLILLPKHYRRLNKFFLPPLAFEFIHGRFQRIRALVDQGSASSFMTENLAQLLHLPRIRTSVSVTGIGDTETPVRHAALITITSSASESPAYTTTALILKSLTRYIPRCPKFPCRWSHLDGLHLADYDPAGSDPIAIIIYSAR